MNDATMQELESQIRELQEQNQQQVTKVAVLEEKMNTKQAETETSIERMSAAFERLRTDMAQRENRQLLATIVIVGVAAGLLGLLITAQ